MSPDLRTDEAGTSKRSKRFIAELPSYLPKKQGVGGIIEALHDVLDAIILKGRVIAIVRVHVV